MVAGGAVDLGGADEEETEVDGGEEEVAGLDDEAPARPDGARGHEGQVLRDAELRCWAREVGGAGEDDAPLLQT